MNKIYLSFFILLVGCSNPNKEYEIAISERLEKDAMGFELNYNSLELEVIEQISINDKISRLEDTFQDLVSQLEEAHYFVKDEFETERIFTLDYLTKDRFTELRNWEIGMRGTPFQSVNNEYPNYYEFASENRGASEWLTEYSKRIEKADIILNRYESIIEWDLELMDAAYWFYLRIENHHTNRDPDEFWILAGEVFDALHELEGRINELKQKNGEEIYHTKIRNRFEINNPAFGGSKQTLQEVFYLDSDNVVFKREEV